MPTLATGAPPVAFVFITHYLTRDILREYEKIEASVAGLGTAWFLFQGEANSRFRKLQNNNREIVSRADLQTLNYRMPFASIVPGSSHFPLLQFHRKHGDYRQYWLIEYDVRFSGDWRTFFGEFVPPGMQNKYYASAPPSRKGLLESGTYRYRPPHLCTGREKDKLYHPVKPRLITIRSRIRALKKRILGRKTAGE